MDRLGQLSRDSKQKYDQFATTYGHSEDAANLLVKIAEGTRAGLLTPAHKRAFKDLLVRAHAGPAGAGAALAEVRRRIDACAARQRAALEAIQRRQRQVDLASGYRPPKRPKRKRPQQGGGGVPAPLGLARAPSGRGGVKQKEARKV